MAGPSYVTVRVMPHRRTWEKGARIAIYWDGTIASGTREGRNPSGTVDYTSPLSQGPLTVWQPGTKGGRGHGRRGHTLRGHGAGGVYTGRGSHPRGRGDRGYGTKYWDWSTQTVNLKLRDGVYTFGIRLFDAKGNRDSGPGVEKRIIVKNTPRPPKELRVTGYSGGVLSLSWRYSVDVKDLA